MSSWTALNVKYDGEYTKPDAFLSEVRVRDHPNDGFDVILDVYQVGNRVETYLYDMAEGGGTIEDAILVTGNDTSCMFTFKLIDHHGETIKKWTDWNDIDRERRVYERIEDEIGRRPDYGGNYRGFSND